MSIQTEIARLSGNVQAALQAIGEKGVSVPDGSGSDDLASLIAQVETGVDTSDATATAASILSGKTAYVNGEKITGTIAAKTSSNLSASGATVTVPAGHYASQASKSVSTATQATPSIAVSTDGLITASATQTAGYVSAGTKSATKQLTTQAAKTVTPTTSSQTAVASGVYTTGAVTVAAMPTATQATPSITVSSAGLITASATQTAGYVAAGTKSATKQLTTQAATTITPSDTEQTAVAAGVYTTGAIKVAALPEGLVQLPENAEYVKVGETTLTEAAKEITFAVDGVLNTEKVVAFLYVEPENWASLESGNVGAIISWSLKGGQMYMPYTNSSGNKDITCAFLQSGMYIWIQKTNVVKAVTYNDNWLFAANIPYKLVIVKMTDFQY